VHGTLRGQGHSTVMIDYVQNEETVEQGEWFYTSGDDRIFPKGMPAGQATVVRPGKAKKDIFVTPSGFQNGLEEVLIVVEGVHAPIPDVAAANQPVHLLAPPPGEGSAPVSAAPAQSGPLTTEADGLLEKYRKLGETQKHVYGERGAGAPNYNAPPAAAPPPKAAAKPAQPNPVRQ
jgi:rod shape-determining protein MreC